MTTYTGGAPPIRVGIVASWSSEAAFALLGFDAEGVAAAESAASACRTMGSHPEGEAASDDWRPVQDVATIVEAKWSFSVLCCATSDQRAVSDAMSVACELAQRGHRAVVLEAGRPPALRAASIQPERSQNQPAHLLLPISEQHGALTRLLAVSATALLSSLACRRIIGVDVADVWSVLGGQGSYVGVHAVAERGQEADAFGRAVTSAVRKAGVSPMAVKRVLLNAVLPSAWRLIELDELATAVMDAFKDADTAIMSAVYDPNAETASVLLTSSVAV